MHKSTMTSEQPIILSTYGSLARHGYEMSALWDHATQPPRYLAVQPDRSRDLDRIGHEPAGDLLIAIPSDM